MKYFRYVNLLAGISLALVSYKLQAQTLFATPDTSPNYLVYQNIQECKQAWSRLVHQLGKSSIDSIWVDTLTRENRENIFRDRKSLNIAGAPKVATEASRVCLRNFNADTVRVTSAGTAIGVVEALMIANRDEDIERFAQRYLDSLKLDAQNNPDPTIRKSALRQYKAGFTMLMRQYGVALPIRYDMVKRYYSEALKVHAGDSLYYSIDAALTMRDFARLVKDSSAQEAAAQLAIRLNDSTPVAERLASPDAPRRLGVLTGIMAQFTQHEALDSIAISSVAYELWYANTVKRRIYGGDEVTREKAQPKKLPKIIGQFYYSSNNPPSDTIRTGLASYSSLGSVPDDEFPIKNKINLIKSMTGLCHIQTADRAGEVHGHRSRRSNCVSFAEGMRQYKRDYPEIEIIGISGTYGAVGQAGPLEPAEEADTQAKYLLGFLRIPARLVVENVENFKLAAPDNRRIDLPTPNSESLGIQWYDARINIITDKEGYTLNVPGISEAWFKRFYEILRDRKSP